MKSDRTPEVTPGTTRALLMRERLRGLADDDSPALVVAVHRLMDDAFDGEPWPEYLRDDRGAA